MISEIDIRDWDKLDTVAARESVIHLDNMIDQSGGGYAFAYINTLTDFINKVELIKKSQVKQIPALFKGVQDN